MEKEKVRDQEAADDISMELARGVINGVTRRLTVGAINRQRSIRRGNRNWMRKPERRKRKVIERKQLIWNSDL